MQKSFVAIGLCLAMQSLCGAARPATALVVKDAWARMAAGSDVAAVYLSLTNTGPELIIVIGVRCPIASRSMMHETSLIKGQSQMRTRDKIVVPPGQTVSFAPGGMHIMLSGLKQRPAAGQNLPLVLLLANGSRVAVAAVVKQPQAP